jgi:hypothetical protein
VRFSLQNNNLTLEWREKKIEKIDSKCFCFSFFTSLHIVYVNVNLIIDEWNFYIFCLLEEEEEEEVKMFVNYRIFSRGIRNENWNIIACISRLSFMSSAMFNFPQFCTTIVSGWHFLKGKKCRRRQENR